MYLYLYFIVKIDFFFFMKSTLKIIAYIFIVHCFTFLLISYSREHNTILIYYYIFPCWINHIYFEFNNTRHIMLIIPHPTIPHHLLCLLHSFPSTYAGFLELAGVIYIFILGLTISLQLILSTLTGDESLQ